MKWDHKQIDQFIERQKGSKADSTITNYQSALRRFEEYINEYDIDIETISGRDMDVFVGQLEGELAESSAAQYIGNVSVFYDWLLMDEDTDNPVKKANPDLDGSSTTHSKPTLTVDQLRDLVNSAGTIRGKALLSLMTSTGMRLAEACNSKLSKLNLEEREIKIDTVKTDFGERTVYFDRQTRRLLDTYINNGYRRKYHDPNSDYIFIASNTNQYKVTEQEDAAANGYEIDNANISTDVGRRIFMRALENSNIDVEYETYSDGRKRSIYTSHILRRSFCQNWIDKNGDIMSLRNIVGWENLETAKDYIDDTTSIDKRDRYGITL
jgi:site-specific recombinase XerD